ncbi:MAG: RNA-binding S4 domain-containing protein [Planktomarina sp.]
MTDGAATLRVDKWLWHARFFKTRTLASKIVQTGKVRVDGTPISKPARTVCAGNVLTFAQGDAIRVVRIVALGERRGPAPEAQALYDDLSPPPPKRDVAAKAPASAGKPTGRDRKAQIAFKRHLQ